MPQNPDDPNDLPDEMNDPLDFDSEVQEDFSDSEYTDAEIADDGNYDEAEIYDENWDEESLDAPPAASPKKKSSLFTMLLIGGAVVVGVGILAFQFSGGKPSAPPSSVEQQAEGEAPAESDGGLMAMQPTNEQQENPPIPETAPSLPIEETAQKGFMDDPSQLQGAPASIDAPPADTVETAAPDLPEQPSMTGFDEPAKPEVPATDTAVTLSQTDIPSIDATPAADLPVPQNLPSIDAIKKADAPKVEPAIVVETPAPVEPLPATSTVVEKKPDVAPIVADTQVQSSREAELQTKLDDSASEIAALKKNIDEMAKAAKAKPVPAAAPDNSAEVEKLQATIAKLEDKVSDLSSRPVATAPVYTNDEPVAKPVRKARKKTPRPSNEQASYSSSPTGTWELRGARPGEAMVGKAGQAGLQTLRVGDNLSGIGQVRSISQIGGRWIVQGTSGSIAQ